MPAKGDQMDLRLTERLWGSIQDVFSAILAHPFIAGLEDGSLDQDSFRYYVVQDSLYLTTFARVLSVCAAKSPEHATIRMFCEHAAGAIDVERRLHEGFFNDFGLSPAQVRSSEMAPTNVAYTSYLLAVAYGGSFPEALAAVLPCYWIYAEVGKVLAERGSPDALYGRWIRTYGSPEFSSIVRSVLQVTDEVGRDLRADEQSRMRDHFRTTARFEWMFWDMGYRQETWPV
jgi:thiaminase/transcriptional activator TenA